jgi:hypothetical protein
MRRSGRSGLPVLAIVLVLLAACAGNATGGDLRVEASVDTKNVAVGENLTLTITVYGDGKISQPDLSALEGFQVAGTYSSQNISIVNARMSRSVSTQYVLVAASAGDHTLGPFTVRSGKDVYQTQPIAVRVTKGQGAAPQAGAPPQSERGREAGGGKLVLAFASVDKKRAYVGEQVTYTLTFAYRANIENVSYVEPDHTGFWFEDVGQSDPAIRVIDGVKYYAITKSTAFFPISSGRHTIGEAGVRYIVEDSDAFSRNPFGAFGRDPFDMFHRREGASSTDPMEIDVLPLPTEGRPSNFTGAVGDFSLSVIPSARQVRVGESLTLSVRIEGRGNIKSIGEIPLPKIEGFRVFAPKSRDSLEVDRNRVGGAKVFDLVLVPEHVGTYSLEGFDLSYFDPARAEYVRTSAPAVKVEVLEGDESTMRALAQDGGTGRIARQDIRHIKREASVADQLGASPGGAAGLALKLVPVLAVLVGAIVAAQRRRLATGGRARVRKARRALLEDLKCAAKSLDNEDVTSASAILSRAIRQYVAARAGAVESAVDAAYVQSLEGITEASRAEIADVLGRVDRVRFAPVSSSIEETRSLVARAEAVLRKVDEEWSE